MLEELFKDLNDSLEDVLKNAEAGEGTIKDNMDDLQDILENEIIKSESTDDEKKALLKRLRKFCNTETNIMLVGATGCGKSSTINALFAVGGAETANGEDVDFEDGDSENGKSGEAKKAGVADSLIAGKVKKTKRLVEVAKVGSKADPETKDIEKYRIGNLVLWDTPGLGDGTEIDEHHKEVITELLREKNDEGNALIDLVLVIMDGSTRDLGTSYKILNDVIIPELKGDTGRILVALNQADIAMKNGRHWNYEKNEPDETLVKFLEEKVESIKKRIKEDSGIDVEPVYYCAGYEEDGGDVVYPYNLSKLLYYIMKSLPAQKRVAIMEGINTDSDNYEHNDDDEDYNSGIKSSFYDSFDCISDGVDKGVEIGGTILGVPGAVVGAVIGCVCGCIKGILGGIFG